MNSEFNRTAIALHWVVAGLIVCSFSLGWVMTDLAISPLKLKMYNWHKWVGITILTLTALRTMWRLTHPAPPPLPMPAWQRISAFSTQSLMYALMFALPLSGWAYSNATGYPVVYLGLLPLPDIAPYDKDMAERLVEVHELFGWLLFGTMSIHVLAALKHHFIDRDATLGRMWHWSSPKARLNRRMEDA